jgi:hypothetical protein
MDDKGKQGERIRRGSVGGRLYGELVPIISVETRNGRKNYLSPNDNSRRIEDGYNWMIVSNLMDLDGD